MKSRDTMRLLERLEETIGALREAAWAFERAHEKEIGEVDPAHRPSAGTSSII